MTDNENRYFIIRIIWNNSGKNRYGKCQCNVLCFF